MTPRTKQTSTTDSPKGALPLVVAFGEDDFRVEQAAKAVIQEQFPGGAPEMALEIVEGCAANQSEGLKILTRLFESLDTLSFFSRERVVWWRNTNLLADNVTARAAAINERIGELVDFLKERGLPEGTTLLVSADAVDARKAFYKLAEKTGRIISFKNERPEEKQHEAQQFLDEQLGQLRVEAEQRARSLLLVLTNGDFRTLKNEAEKLAAYVGPGGRIREEDVHRVASARPEAIVWDLTGAFDRRDIARALEKLDQLRYQGEKPVGLLFALISHVRQLLFLRELLDIGVLKPVSNPGHLAGQISRMPASVQAQLPKEKKWNPLLGNPYALFHRMSGAEKYAASELRRAMVILLDCNEQLVTTDADFYWLENAILKILTGQERPLEDAASRRSTL